MTTREKDIVRLAEYVMGWKIQPDRSGSGVTMFVRPDACNIATWKDARGGDGRSWNPFESIADAWMLVEKLRRKYCFQLDSVGHRPNIWRCMIGWGDDIVQVQEEGKTACGAICATALATLDATLRQAGLRGPMGDREGT